MAFRVLVVDDSSFFRRRVTEILTEDGNLEVIDVAINGVEAVEKAVALKPDVITMDIEMPLLNGIDAVKQIMAKAPTAILMFSSLTHQGAKATLDALDAGALDFLPKKFNEIAKNATDASQLLRQRVSQLARKNARHTNTIPQKKTPSRAIPASSRSSLSADNGKQTADKRSFSYDRSQLTTNKIGSQHSKNYQLVAIGASTGGPIAVQSILSSLPGTFPLPIILVQHMPATFTEAFSNRLNKLCAIEIKQAEDGERLKPGCAYVAPGGKQMILEGRGSGAKIRILADNSERISFKPSVDISFGSAAKILNGDVLGIILTGMGADGREGCRMLKAKGATIWTQTEESCVVYGMPQAVDSAKLSDGSYGISDFSKMIVKEVGSG